MYARLEHSGTLENIDPVFHYIITKYYSDPDIYCNYIKTKRKWAPESTQPFHFTFSKTHRDKHELIVHARRAKFSGIIYISAPGKTQ